MIEVKISEQLHNKLNDSRLGILFSNVKVIPTPPDFNKYISNEHQLAINSLETKNEKEFDIIKETRSAYKLCGKEPSRYRPSAEALLKRLRTKRSLYQVNNVVDAINLMSINTRYSIGGFDYSQIQGKIVCDIGNSDIYEAIGRGSLNIEFMPGLRDDVGFFGTPTSDSDRTKVTDTTKELLLVFYDFYGNDNLEEAINYGEQVLNEYCHGKTIYKSIA